MEIKKLTQKLCYDFEEWEIDYELREKKDYPGLVKYYKEKVERFPADETYLYYLGDAYVLNGEYNKAIELFTEPYRKRPDTPNFHQIILDALFASGKNEDNFDWIEKPVVLRMSDKVLAFCYEFLKKKKKSRDIAWLYTELIIKGYLLFKKEDLFNALKKDNRFIVNDFDKIIYFAEVSITK